MSRTVRYVGVANMLVRALRHHHTARYADQKRTSTIPVGTDDDDRGWVRFPGRGRVTPLSLSPKLPPTAKKPQVKRC